VKHHEHPPVSVVAVSRTWTPSWSFLPYEVEHHRIQYRGIPQLMDIMYNTYPGTRRRRSQVNV